jgi:hypothetical protein
MGRKVDVRKAAASLDTEFQAALSLYLKGVRPYASREIASAIDTLFLSKTQSFREALLGCLLAKITDGQINVRLPYATQGKDAFQGRALDEMVVNPFLQQCQIPCSKGPYLAVFRRSVKFTRETRDGLRDKTGYDAFLILIDFLESATRKEAKSILRLLLWKFIELREEGKIELARIQRLSVDQYEELIRKLLDLPSGGLLPVLLAVAMFQTLSECFNLNWVVEWQGLNVADRASGMGGDITIRSSGKVLLAVEITERTIEKNRVIATFNTKITVHGLEDYLFLFARSAPEKAARDVAQQYFGQGHEITFLPVGPWLVNCLGTIGSKCRKIFSEKMLVLMDQPTVPAHVKIAWNEKHAELLR